MTFKQPLLYETFLILCINQERQSQSSSKNIKSLLRFQYQAYTNRPKKSRFMIIRQSIPREHWVIVSITSCPMQISCISIDTPLSIRLNWKGKGQLSRQTPFEHLHIPQISDHRRHMSQCIGNGNGSVVSRIINYLWTMYCWLKKLKTCDCMYTRIHYNKHFVSLLINIPNFIFLQHLTVVKYTKRKEVYFKRWNIIITMHVTPKNKICLNIYFKEVISNCSFKKGTFLFCLVLFLEKV